MGLPIEKIVVVVWARGFFYYETPNFDHNLIFIWCFILLAHSVRIQNNTDNPINFCLRLLYLQYNYTIMHALLNWVSHFFAGESIILLIENPFYHAFGCLVWSDFRGRGLQCRLSTRWRNCGYNKIIMEMLHRTKNAPGCSYICKILWLM